MVGKVTLRVLGIAQDGGHPQMGCRRACCAGSWSSGGHQVASLGLIGPSGLGYLLDASPDFPAQAHALGAPAGLGGVLLTHAHAGHYTGLWHLGKEALAASSMPIWAMERMHAFLMDNQPWAAVFEQGHGEHRALAADQTVLLEPGLSVVPRLVPHRGPWSETIALEVVGERRLIFAPDVDHWRDVDIVGWLERCDVVMVDGTFFSSSELGGRDMSKIPHPTVVSTMKTLEDVPRNLRDRLYFIHLNHTNPLLDPSSEECKMVLDWGAHVAREGMEFVL